MKHSVEAEPIRDGLAELRRDPRRAVLEEEIVCLVCGHAFRQITNTHLLSHGLTSSDYKREHGYNPGRAMMCHALRRVYAARAVRVPPGQARGAVDAAGDPAEPACAMGSARWIGTLHPRVFRRRLSSARPRLADACALE